MTDQNEFEMNVTASADGATVTVAVGGEIDASNAGRICPIVTAAHDTVPAQRVVLDLSGVDFLDSSGISALVECRNHLGAMGVSLDVVGAQGDPLRVLELTGVLDFLQSSSIDDEDHSQASG